MKKFLSIFLFLSHTVLAQEQHARDSLRRLVVRAGEDVAAVELYYQYGESFAGEQEDTALYYYDRGRALSMKINYGKGVADYAGLVLPILNNRGQFRAALETAKESLDMYKKRGKPDELARAHLNLGSEWQYLSDFATAADHYLESRKYAERIHDLSLLRKSNNNLASVFLSLSQFQKGKQYATEALKYARQLGNDQAISSTLYNLATAEVYLLQYDTAIALFQSIEEIARKLNDPVIFLDTWLGKAGAYSGLNNASQALYYYDKVIAFSKEHKIPEYEMYAYMGKADLYIKTNHTEAAGEAVSKGLVLAKQLETKYELKDLLLKGSALSEKTGNYSLALDYYKQAQILNDTIIGEKNQVVIANNEARYEFEKKQAAINGLLAEKQLHQLTIRQQKIVNYILIGGAAALLIIALLLIRNYRHKQRLQKQRIAELERERKLTATEAILKGEEQERSRLAKDLHDGLGGMLSGVKHSLSNIKGNLILTEENGRAFEHSIHMLDNSIAEMRRVAHNMMPESLMKFGLDAALNDFCNQVSVSGVASVSYQSMGLEHKPVEHSLAITVYRVVQELLNNAIKHAAARMIIVQLTREESQLTLTVEDDGKGFDVKTLKSAKGIGWKNITSRLDYHNGKLDIRSGPGKGTSVFIELAIV